MSSQQLDSKEANRLKNMAGVASVTLAVCLSLLKLFASIYTGSLAILSSMVDSLTDLVSSIITLIAIKFASQPASYHHRYGYGKAEALSALIQAAFVFGSAFFVIYEGINRFWHPREIVDMGVGLVVMVISLGATLILIAFQKYVIKKTNSLAVSADSLHYVIDVATNTSIIISLVLVKIFQIFWFDTLAAVLIAGYLFYNAYGLICDATNMLMDKELDEEVRDAVVKVVKECGGVEGMHDLRTRDIGGIYVFEFHLELGGNLHLSKAHELAHRVEDKILELYPKSQVIIHQEPVGIEDERLDNKLV